MERKAPGGPGGRGSSEFATARTETATPRPTLALGILLTALMLVAAPDAMSAATSFVADDASARAAFASPHTGVVIADPPTSGAEPTKGATEPTGTPAALGVDFDASLPLEHQTDPPAPHLDDQLAAPLADPLADLVMAPVAGPIIWPLVVGGLAALLLFIALRGWSLPRNAPTEALPPMHLAGLAIAMLLMAPIGATIAAALTGVRGGDDALRTQGVLMLGAYSAQAIVVVAWLVMRRSVAPAVGTVDESGVAATRPRVAVFARAAGIGALTFAVAWPIVAATVAIAGAIRLGVTGEPTEQLAHETLKALDEGTGAWRIAVALLAALAAPLFEEILFRGMMQPALRTLGAAPWPAIILVSTFFAVVHWGAVPPPALPGLLVLSIAFGWARERTGGLTAPIVAHILFNVGNLALAGAL